MQSPGQTQNEEDFNPQKVLRIRREDADGNWTTEIVRDPAVIKAYMRSREAVEAELLASADIDSLAPSNDAERNEKIRLA